MTTPSLGLDDMAFFVAVVDAGGFTAAARELDVRKALVSRRVQALERSLGVRLLERTTRAVAITEAGRAFYERAARAVSLGREARALVETRATEPAGLLRISATQTIAEQILPPLVFAYLARHPHASVEVDVDSHHVDVVRDGFDLAIRIAPPSDSQLLARVLGRGRALYVAAPGYVAAHGAPKDPQALSQTDAVVVSGGPIDWDFQRGRVRLRIRPRARLLTPSYRLARDAALAGVGVARLPRFFVHEDLDAGRLVPVLGPWTPPEVAVAAVFPAREHMAAKTRAFLALVSEHLAKRPLVE